MKSTVFPSPIPGPSTARAVWNRFSSGIPGIGKTRAAALYRHFKTVKAISAASEEDLLAAPGMTRPAAEAVYGYFHPVENAPD